MIDILKKRMKIDLLKKCHDLYRNLWFLIAKKKKSKYKLINAIMKMNEMIIRDVNLLFTIDEFAKKFARLLMILLINFFFEYDYFKLTKKCRNIIVFMTLIDFIRFTKIFMSVTNSVAQFVRVITKILKNYILTRCRFFVNDVKIKRFKNNYDNREIIFDVRLFVLKHI